MGSRTSSLRLEQAQGTERASHPSSVLQEATKLMAKGPSDY